MKYTKNQILYIIMAVLTVGLAVSYSISVSSTMSDVSWCGDSCIKGSYISSVCMLLLIIMLIFVRFATTPK